MPRHFEYLKFRAEKTSVRRFFDKEIRFGWLDFELESEISKKVAIRNHRRGQRMATDLAIEAALDFRHILDVIDVAMGQQQQL